MSDLTKEDVKKIGKLARIRLTEQEVEKFTPELQSIFDWVEQLQEVDTENVPPMAGVGGYNLRFREFDEVNDGDKRDEVLKNAPKDKFGCFVVPKVVDQG